MRYQNYQKHKKSNDDRKKQQVTDMINLNMKSLNVHPHWDIILTKLVPHLNNSISFGKNILMAALYFIQKYLEITNHFNETPKFLLMMANSKNIMFLTDRRITQMINKIK